MSLRQEDLDLDDYSLQLFYMQGQRIRRFTLQGEREGKVTLRLAFTRPGDEVPLFTRERELHVLGHPRAEEARRAVEALGDAECTAIHRYLRQVSRAALLAYADSLQEAIARAQNRGGEFFVLDACHYHSRAMAEAMRAVSAEGLPEDIRAYLHRAADIWQQLDGSMGISAPPSVEEATLMALYPRAAACLPLLGGRPAEFQPGLFEHLRAATYALTRQAKRQWMSEGLDQRATTERMVGELRRLAEAVPTGPVEAAEARRALMKRALEPCTPGNGRAAMDALASFSDAECLALEHYLRQASAQLRARLAEALESGCRDAATVFRDELMPEALAATPMDGLPEDCRLYLRGLIDAANAASQLKRDPATCADLDALQSIHQEYCALTEQYPRASLILEEERLAARLRGPHGFPPYQLEEDEAARLLAALRAAAPQPAATAEQARLALTRLALHQSRPFLPTMELDICLGQEHLLALNICKATGYNWQLAEPLPEDAPLSFSVRCGANKPSYREGEAASPLEPLPGDLCFLTLTPQREGRIRLPLAFTRPGDAEPLFTAELILTITPAETPETKDSAKKVPKSKLTKEEALERAKAALEEQDKEAYEKLKVIDHGDYYTVTPDLPPDTLGGGWSVDLNANSGKILNIYFTE